MKSKTSQMLIPRPRPAFSKGMAWVGLGLMLLTGCNSTPKESPAKAASFWPPTPSEPRIQYLTSFEKSSDIEPPKSELDKIIMGKEPQEVLPISKPYGVKMWQGKIYVCDISQHAVVVLDLRGRVTRMVGVTGAVHLQTPSDIAIAPDGTKYVADLGKPAIVVYNAADQYVATFTPPDSKPVGVAVRGNDLAVADYVGQRVLILDRFTGQVKRTVGKPGAEDGQFVRPLAVAYDKSGNLFVNDFMRCRIQKFSPEGKFLKGYGDISTATGDFIRPKHIAVDSEDILYVVDAAFQNVQMINATGRVLTFFGSAGGHPGAMFLPAGICITEDPKDLELFQNYAHPAFDVKRLILVTNQFGPAKVAVYGYGKLKEGKTLADIAGGRNAVPVGMDNSATRPTTLPALPPEGLTVPEPKVATPPDGPGHSTPPNPSTPGVKP